MPGFNQTGPSGRGPMTGSGRGFCRTGRPADETGILGDAYFVRAAGFGRGFRCGPGPEMRGFMERGLGRNRTAFMEDIQVEIDSLKMQAESMKRTLDTISQRLSELEKSE